jgi:sRNA-binding carbon storage regulator CsrA
MLVLTVRGNGVVWVHLPDGRKCKMQLLELRRDPSGYKVRIGFHGPEDVLFYRGELCLADGTLREQEAT